MSILIVRTGHLGDTITAIPALRLIRAWAPAARLTLLCDSPLNGQTAAKSVVEPLGLVDQIEAYPARPFWRTYLLVRRVVRHVRPDMAVILGQVRATPVSLVRQWAALRLFGINDVRIANPIFAGKQIWPGEAERLCHGLREVGIYRPTPAFDIPLDQQARARVKQMLAALGVPLGAPYLVFCGGGKAPTQRWPLDRYAAVLAGLAESHRMPLVVIGSGSEIEQYRAAFRAVPLNMHYLEGLGLTQLFELMRGARAYLGNDTGPMHVAASVGCPVIAVVSARNPPGQWYPEVQPSLVFRKEVPCQNCFLQECIVERHRCMTDLSSAEVSAGARRFLDMLENPAISSGNTESEFYK